MTVENVIKKLDKQVDGLLIVISKTSYPYLFSILCQKNGEKTVKNMVVSFAINNKVSLESAISQIESAHE